MTKVIAERSNATADYTLIIPTSPLSFARLLLMLSDNSPLTSRQTSMRGVASRRIIASTISRRLPTWEIAISTQSFPPFTWRFSWLGCRSRNHERRPHSLGLTLLYHRSSWFRVKRSASLKRHMPSNAPKSLSGNLSRERAGASSMSGIWSTFPIEPLRALLHGVERRGVGLSKVYSIPRLFGGNCARITWPAFRR